MKMKKEKNVNISALEGYFMKSNYFSSTEIKTINDIVINKFKKFDFDSYPVKNEETFIFNKEDISVSFTKTINVNPEILIFVILNNNKDKMKMLVNELITSDITQIEPFLE